MSITISIIAINAILQFGIYVILLDANERSDLKKAPIVSRKKIGILVK